MLFLLVGVTPAAAVAAADGSVAAVLSASRTSDIVTGQQSTNRTGLVWYDRHNHQNQVSISRSTVALAPCPMPLPLLLPSPYAPCISVRPYTYAVLLLVLLIMP